MLISAESLHHAKWKSVATIHPGLGAEDHRVQSHLPIICTSVSVLQLCGSPDGPSWAAQKPGDRDKTGRKVVYFRHLLTALSSNGTVFNSVLSMHGDCLQVIVNHWRFIFLGMKLFTRVGRDVRSRPNFLFHYFLFLSQSHRISELEGTHKDL